MDLKLQPKPEVEILPADRGIVSRKEFFVKKKFEKINQYFFAGHFIRDWKPKAELIYSQVPNEAAIQYEYDFNREVQNCFVEDYAEEVFLRTPPPCFVVFGKFEQKVNELCEKLSNEYGSVLIQVDDIVNQVIKKNTDTSKLLDRILRLGVSITLNFILALVSYVAHTPEARHRGYVLSGLPCLPLSYDLSVEQQFHYLFTWDNKPTVFINLLFNDEDLIKERTNLRVDFTGGEKQKCFRFHSLYQWVPDDEDESDVDEDMLPIIEDPPPFEPDVNISPSRQWAQLPRDEESRVWHEFEEFDNIIRPVIELINSRVDPQYFITLDSRLHNEFEVVRARLELLQVWKAPEAVRFFPPKGTDEFPGEDDEEEEIPLNDDNDLLSEARDKPPQAGFLALFTEKTISPKFRWELSHYNYICPVSLREGEVVEGKTKFAVRFMKYIYFLRDEQAVVKFMQNPRAFVLPVRPKPLCRFIILGYPFSGKTSLATALSNEFSIPLINVNTILRNDLIRKKEAYEEFCKQKAECREIIRLTTQAWQDWRMEEERRINLIEEWILYIGTLLNKRIEQFYSGGSVDDMPTKIAPSSEHQSVAESAENILMKAEDSIRSGESSRREEQVQSLELRGTPIGVSRPAPQNPSTPSGKLVQAMKHEDFDFNKNGTEVEANLFFSSLWNTFSEGERNTEKVTKRATEFGEEEEGEFDVDEEKDEPITVDWCNLLPPQSLSSLLMSRRNCTTREKRQSFKIFLEAASKVYWAPSALKSEFAKWRLPCFMDIPLCELFLDNPILLLKYLPEWLKERPLIPDPIDPSHPSVVEASRQAFLRARVVSIKQTPEEVGILVRHAIEKAEREGMRVTGEVISPGGWVVDNMSLDMEVWNKLACENVFADHIYVLIDSEPEYRRIFNTWWKQCGSEQVSEEFSRSTETDHENTGRERPSIRSERVSSATENQVGKSGEIRTLSNENSDGTNSVIRILLERVKEDRQGNTELDAIYRSLVHDNAPLPEYFIEIPSNSFSASEANDRTDFYDKTPEHFTGDNFSIQSLNSAFIYSIGKSPNAPKVYPEAWNIPLGGTLETVTSKLLNYFKKTSEKDLEKARRKEVLQCGLEFFYFFLTLPQKLGQIKHFLTDLGRGATLNEIEITGKTPEAVIAEVRNELMTPFIKKPRELEDFEIEEIKKSSREEALSGAEESEGELEEEDDTGEDIRIFGESGPLCVVNLERDICLPGKLEHALRYYGKLYYFWNEDAKNKFIEDPEKYAPYYSAIRCYPPLRLFVTGPVGSGKTTLANTLSQQCGIPKVEYPVFLLRRLVPHSSFKHPNLLTDQVLLLSDEDNAPARKAKELFLQAPLDKRKFWLEQSLYSDFLDKDMIMKRIMSVQQQRALSETVPSFTYLCVESISQEELQDEEYSELSKSESLLPQTPYASMKEIETIITNYLTDNSDLNDYCIEKSFKTLWTEFPYITEGFVLESFPMRSYDVNVIIENNWIPDLVLELVVPESDVIERNIDNLMELWVTKLKRETVEEKLLEDTLINIRNTWAVIRKAELLQEKRKALLEGQESLKQGSFGSQPNPPSLDTVRKAESSKTMKEQNFSTFSIPVDDTFNYSLSESFLSSVEEEIEEILTEESPPLEFNPVFETYDAGKARIIEKLISTYRMDAKEIEKVKGTLKEAGVPWLEIDGLKSLDEILPDLFRKMDQIRKRIMHKGEFAFTLTMEMAEKLLHQGYYFLSKFGRWCPVQVYRMKNPIHMFRPFSARGKVTPIAYRNYIYFVAGEHEKTQFLEDPIKYTFNEPHHPNIPLRIAVIGAPKSGKTTLCTRLGMMFDLKVITMGSALRFALEKTETSTLAKLINSYLRRGCFLPLSLKIEALMVCLNDPSCHTQGFVLDGIPFDAALTQSLAEKGKLPFVIISLVADSYFGKTNREKLDLKLFRIPCKNRTNLDTRYQDWNETYKRFAQWNQNTYNNLYEVNAKLNVVDIFYQAYDIIRKSFFGILYYVEYCVSGRVLPLQYLCISQHEYELRKSLFHNNCPVCWVEKNRLSSSADPPPRSGLVQYGNHFYWICPEDMQKFIENPKIYFLPHAPKWPEVLPQRLNANMFAAYPKMIIHGNGRCPVTRTDFPDDLDWEGSWDYAALYADKVFLCKNEEMLNRFLGKPWRYHEADTLFEAGRSTKSSAVENLGPLKIASLPPIGFLEQTVADLIHDSLQLLGCVRPIYPNMSPSVTGCIFVALYLKVHNKKRKTPLLELHYFNFMLKSCKAFMFKLASIRPTKKQIGQGDFEDQESENSENSEDSDNEKSERSSARRSSTNLFDFGKNEKTMWSAKKMSTKYTEMKLTEDDELLEIPAHPRVITVLTYETQNTRRKPIPPVLKCLNFIYSVTPPLRLPEKFNFRTLYQPASLNSCPVALNIMYNPNKAFAISLYKREKTSFTSTPNICKGQRAMSDITLGEYSILREVEPDNEYLKKRFIPRFRLHDKVTPTIPAVPQIVPDKPLFYHPHRDYAYTVLLSEFFCTTHVLKFYEWNNHHQLLEFSNRLDNTLMLTRTQVEYFHKPRVTASERSRTSLDSYLQIFDAATLFAVGAAESQMSIADSNKMPAAKSSTYNFIQTLLQEKIEELFEDMYYSTLSFDTFDFTVSTVEGKPTVVLAEVLPYPPLPWDIISRPYHAYRSLHAIFKKPSLDNIAHERHFSLLDGITDSTSFRFLQIPSFADTHEGQKMFSSPRTSTQTPKTRRIPLYVFYDFFNIPWSAFLPYPYSATYHQEITDCWQ